VREDSFDYKLNKNGMISYELAKQLKEAGFPQEGNGNYHSAMAGEHDVYYPTLAELIDGCGNNFDYLSHDPRYQLRGKNGQHELWWATSWSRKDAGGSSPEEAVARLWLALSKNV
jgi:hypothetical protein